MHKQLKYMEFKSYSSHANFNLRPIPLDTMAIPGEPKFLTKLFASIAIKTMTDIESRWF